MTRTITRMDASHITGIIGERELSPVEVIQAHLDRILAVNTKGAQLGLFHSIPFTVREGIEEADVLTQLGLPIFKGRIAETAPDSALWKLQQMESRAGLERITAAFQDSAVKDEGGKIGRILVADDDPTMRKT